MAKTQGKTVGTTLKVALVGLALLLGMDAKEPAALAFNGRLDLEPSALRFCERATVQSSHALERPMTPLDVVVVFDISLRKKEWENAREHIKRIATALLGEETSISRLALVEHHAPGGPWGAQLAIKFTSNLIFFCANSPTWMRVGT